VRVNESRDIDTEKQSDCIDCIMTSITIRRIPTSTKEKLRLRATRSGLSLESYTRQILQAAAEKDTDGTPDLADLAESCFGKNNGIDLELPPRGGNRAPLSFD
jgi:plasmid stability protein